MALNETLTRFVREGLGRGMPRSEIERVLLAAGWPSEVVYTFLGGELTARFLLKLVVVAIIAGAVFGYYRWDLGEDEATPET
jgi:hypothetical protein